MHIVVYVYITQLYKHVSDRVSSTWAKFDGHWYPVMYKNISPL